MRRWLGFLAVLFAITQAAGSVAAEQRRAFHPTQSDSEAGRRLAKKDYAGAIMEANHALKTNPADPLALTTRGYAYLELGDYAHAIEDYDAVLLIAPSDPGALTNACFGRAVANIELDRAKSYCDAAVVQRGGLAGLDSRGFLSLRRGDYAAALKDYEAAMKLSHAASPLYGRGIAKMRLGRTDEAKADLAEALKQQPDIGGYYSRRGVEP